MVVRQTQVCRGKTNDGGSWTFGIRTTTLNNGNCFIEFLGFDHYLQTSWLAMVMKHERQWAMMDIDWIRGGGSNFRNGEKFWIRKIRDLRGSNV